MNLPPTDPRKTVAWNLERSWLPVLLALGGVIALAELTNLDLAVQDKLFDFGRGRWLVDQSDPAGQAWFYTGPKAVLFVGGLSLLLLALYPPSWRPRGRPAWSRDRRGLLICFFTLGLAPLAIGQLKGLTNIYCPAQIERYGGTHAYVRLLERHPNGLGLEKCGRCWPAGHASGGFALLALAGLARTRRGQLQGLLAGLVAGGLMGGYQMAKGAHYLSHTVVTALLVWLTFLILRQLPGLRSPPASS